MSFGCPCSGARRSASIDRVDAGRKRVAAGPGDRRRPDSGVNHGATRPDLLSARDRRLSSGPASIILPLFHRLGLSAVLGHLLAGGAIGPYGLGPFADRIGLRRIVVIDELDGARCRLCDATSRPCRHRAGTGHHHGRTRAPPSVPLAMHATNGRYCQSMSVPRPRDAAARAHRFLPRPAIKERQCQKSDTQSQSRRRRPMTLQSWAPSECNELASGTPLAQPKGK